MDPKTSGRVNDTPPATDQLLARVVTKIATGKPTLGISRTRSAHLKFAMLLQDLGIQSADMPAARKLFAKAFYADFIAELIMRRNVQAFRLAVADVEEFEMMVGGARHRHFGVVMDCGTILFELYASKVQEVMDAELEELLR